MMLEVDERVNNLLSTFGLTDTERNLYLAGLTKSSTTVSELIGSTGVNRTTAYHALSTLKQKGFATEAKANGKLIYEMTQPDDLVAYLDRRSAAIDIQRQQLKEITSLFPMAPEEVKYTSVEKFEGFEGVKEAVDRALYCKSRKWRIVAPKENIFSQVNKDYANYFMDTRRQHKIKARSLWEPSDKGVSLSLQTIFERNPRYLPRELAGQFKSVIIVYDNKALFISSAKSPGAVIVESNELISTLKVMFDGLWLLSQKPTSK